MKSVAILAQKGGTGKTTVAVNLAASAFERGLRTLIADLDPQGSSVDWTRARKGAGPSAVALKSGALFPAQVAAQNSGVEFMVVDTRASSQIDVITAAKVADLCLVVVRPTVIDLRAIAATMDLVKPLRRPMAFVINQAPSQRVGREPVIVTEALELLLSYGVAVAPVGLRSRQVYQTAFVEGLSLREKEPGCAAALEMGRLWDYVAERLWRDPAQRPTPPSEPRNDVPSAFGGPTRPAWSPRAPAALVAQAHPFAPH